MTPEEITTIKKQHSELFSIECSGHIGYFRKPNRNDVNAAAAFLDPNTPLDYFSTIMRDCFVGGSDAIIENDEFFLGAMKEFKPLVEGAKAILAKV